MSDPPALSVVIPTRNRRDLVERLLTSLEQQTFDPQRVEVLVVDDGSTDGTSAMIELRAGPSPLRLRCLANPGQGTCAARNHGLSQAQGAIVGFMDDDVVCRNDCLERALGYFASSETGAVESQLLIEGTDRPLMRSSEQGFNTGAIFYRHEALDRIGGFDEGFFDPATGIFFRDDLDLGFRLLDAGYQAVKPPDVIVWHPAMYFDLPACFRHARRYMMEPRLYRKHPRRFRKTLERQRIGPLSLGRPLHYACLGFVAGLVLCVASLVSGRMWLTVPAVLVAVIAYAGIRIKYEGARAGELWRVRDSAGFALLPFWYFRWYLRGCVKFGGWGSLL